MHSETWLYGARHVLAVSAPGALRDALPLQEAMNLVLLGEKAGL